MTDFEDDFRQIRLVRLRRLGEKLGLSVGLQNWLIDGDEPLAGAGRFAATRVPKLKGGATKVSGAITGGLKDVLARLVHDEVPFSEINEAAWVAFCRQPERTQGALLIESAFLHGTIEDVCGLLGRFNKDVSQYFRAVQPRLRELLVLRLWQANHNALLASCVHPDWDDASHLERLYGFYALQRADSHVEALVYFLNHEQAILAAVGVWGSRLKMSVGEVLLGAAELCLALDYAADAGRLLQSIASDDPVYERAGTLLLKISVPRDEAGRSRFQTELESAPDWPQRIKLFYAYLGALSRGKTMLNCDRPALNELVKDAFAWVPEEPEAWAAMSSLLYENRHLVGALPQLFDFYREQATCFHRSNLDLALWQPFANYQGPDPVAVKVWRGLAKLHCFVQSESPQELLLWDAFDDLSDVGPELHQRWGITWSRLYRAAIRYISKTPEFLEGRRRWLLNTLAIATDDKNLVATDVMGYLKNAKAPPYSVLQRLHDKVHRLGDDRLALQVLAKKAAMTHYTNEDLKSLWLLANRWQRYDLSWKVASVLQARDVLQRRIYHAWSISGEKRDEYLTLPVGINVIGKLLADFTVEERRVIDAIIRVGPFIPQLYSILDPQVRVVRRGHQPLQALASVASNLLAQISWLPMTTKQYLMADQAQLSDGVRLPHFLGVIPENLWARLVVALIDRLGIGAWNFELSVLGHFVDGVIPKTSQGLRDRYSIKVAKWLRQLSPEARNAWYDLPKVCQRVSAERGREIQAQLVFRLALLLNENPFSALATLKSMRVPVAMVWQFETWLLSHDYQEVRQLCRQGVRSPVPEILRQMDPVATPRVLSD